MDIDYSSIDSLVLSGGSIHGILLLGALHHLIRNENLINITNYIGTSVGSIINYLLCIGYKPLEIIQEICKSDKLNILDNLNMVKLLNGKGGISFKYIHDYLETLTIKKIGKLLTLQQLYSTYKKNMICISHNITSNKSVNLNYIDNPDMNCLLAVKLSSSMPFIFEKNIYKGDSYIDGGIINNFPIEIGIKYGKNILGLALIEKVENLDKITNIADYLYKLICSQSNQITKNKISEYSNRSNNIVLYIKKENFLNFNISIVSKLEMFSNGYNQMKDYTEKKIKLDNING